MHARSKFSRRQFVSTTGTMVGATMAARGYSLARADESSEAPSAIDMLVDGEPPVAEEASTIVILPDTQNYSEKFPEIFDAQTRWIAENATPRNIAFVLHLGDITNRNTPAEWINAKRSMDLLKAIPFVMATGNHDYSEGGAAVDRSTLYGEYFPIAEARSRQGFGGTFDGEPNRLDNSWWTFIAAGRKWLIVSLEFAPRNEVLSWADQVISSRADHSTILITHAFLYYDETRYDWKGKGTQQNWNPHSYGVSKHQPVNDGEELWEKLVSRHDNCVMAINGHVLGDGLGRMTSQTNGGTDVMQMLVNFQMKPSGGDGWLRLLEIQKGSDSKGQRVKVYDYSPTLGKTNASPQNQFQFSLPPSV